MKPSILAVPLYSSMQKKGYMEERERGRGEIKREKGEEKQRDGTIYHSLKWIQTKKNCTLYIPQWNSGSPWKTERSPSSRGMQMQQRRINSRWNSLLSVYRLFAVGRNYCLSSEKKEEENIRERERDKTKKSSIIENLYILALCGYPQYLLYNIDDKHVLILVLID